MSHQISIRSYNESILRSLEEGDLVEFPRGVYSHWAVYLGNEEVAHLAGEGEGIGASVTPGSVFTICGVQFDKAKVCKDNFWTVAKDSKALKNNEKDEEWSPFSPTEIVENAVAKLGEVGYNLIFSNCESFAKWCRYGRSQSEQANNLMIGAGLVLGTGMVIGIFSAIFRYFKKDEREQEKKQEVSEKKIER